MDEAEREPVNGWLHFGGALLAAAGLGVLAGTALEHAGARHLVGAVTFGVTAIAMFGASALYHLRHHSPRRTVFRRLDHAMIYLFIAGTYTPVCLIGLQGRRLGAVLLALVWLLALAGAAQKLCLRYPPRVLSTALYLGTGWLGALAIPALRGTVPAGFTTWLLVGGVLYSVGAMFHLARWPRGVPGRFGFHELWHVFVLAASASHYWAILHYLMPLA